MAEEIPLPVIDFQPQNGCIAKHAGLDDFKTVDELRLYPQRSTDYKYLVTNKQNDNMYKVQIDSEASHCQPQRPYTIQLLDNSDAPIMKITHSIGCESCFCCALPQKVDMFTPPDTPVGSLEQEWNLLYPTFAVKNENKEIMLRIEGPCSRLTCCSDPDFKIITPDGEKEIGQISREHLYSKITFAETLDAKTKALLLGSCLVVNLTYWNV
uniref:Phospholipid scramblase n=1 Tax=Photinus pyralis TaxID=7054 RepID=A0A1Y1LX89_PHOPY